jgi:hypothetical protein
LRSILLFLSLLLQIVNAAEHADFIFVNGNIHAVNERQRDAEAVAVKGQRIVFVGSNQDAPKFRGAKTRIIDLGRSHSRARHDRFALPHLRNWRARDEFESQRDEHAGRLSRECERARRKN